MQEHPSHSNAHPRSESSLPNIGISTRRVLWIGLLATVTIAVLFALGDAPTTVGAIKAADWRLVGVAVLIHYSGFAVRGNRWQLLLRTQGYRLGYLRITSVLLGGWFVSALLPARLGEVFRIAVLRLPQQPDQPTVPVADSLGSIILERALDIMALLILSAVFGYLALDDALPSWISTSYVIAFTLLAFLALALLSAPGILNRLRTLSNNQLWTSIVGFTQQTVDSLRQLPAHPIYALVTLFESVYIWLCDALLLWLVLAAIGVQLDFSGAGFVALTVDITAAVPLTPGGIGQIEAVYSALLSLLSLAPANIAAAVLLVRLISYWSFLVFSGIVTMAAGFGSLFRQTNSNVDASA